MFVLAYDNRKGINQVCVDSPKNYSFSKSNKKITTLKLMEDIFMINQLMT